MTMRADHDLMPPMLRVALDAARIGHVLPLRPFTKVPALDDWERRSTQDPDDIRKVWAHRAWNVGIACGPSGLHVLDLDDAHGRRPPADWAGARHGRDVLDQLVTSSGEHVPDTFTVRTPHRGQHLYFSTQDTTLRSTVAKLGWRIDSRGAGGYVVAAGSILRTGTYHADIDHPIATLPHWIADRISAPSVEPAQHSFRQRPCTARDHRRVNAYVARVLARVNDAETGERHNTLLRAAYTLGRLVAGDDLDGHTAQTLLHQAAQRFVGVDHWTTKEGDDTITDGLAAGKHDPRCLTAEP